MRAILIFPPALITSFFYRLICKINNRQIWMVCETKSNARDNGYFFFLFLQHKHPEIASYYAIDKQSPQYEKLQGYSSSVINFDSFKHWVYYLSSKWNISNHKHGNPNPALFYILHVKLHLFNNRIFLQHGILKDDAPYIHKNATNFRMFICGAKPEYDFVRSHFGYTKSEVKYTGLARFDNLQAHLRDQPQANKIAIIPTWRNWLGITTGTTPTVQQLCKFIKSNYYDMWRSLLESKHFHDLAKKYNLEIIFLQHEHMQPFNRLFTGTEYIKVADINQCDISSILLSSSLLITDYSSVFMDFAYLKKPTIYYQPDCKEFRAKHLAQGYFDYKEDGFGKCVEKESALLEELEKSIVSKHPLHSTYAKRIKEFYALYDNQNCQRIFREIIKLDK